MPIPAAERLSAVDPGPPWAERDAPARRAMLDGILAQISHDALQGEGLDAVLQGIVDSLARRLPVAIASILLVDAAGTMFVQEVWAGDLLLVDVSGSADGEPWSLQIGAAGRCARTGEPQLIVDVHADPDYVPGNPDVRSEYLVPIRHRGVLLGVLNLESTHVDFFTPEACAVFDAIALQVAGAIHLASVARELELANRKLEALSMLDGLTGIANRRHFDQQLHADWARMAQVRQPLALLLVDADCFKALNDACGHLYGDECLRELARLCSTLASTDTDLVARYGGEEIALLLPGRDLRQARQIGERLRRKVEAMAMPHPASTAAGVVTVSVGAAVACPGDDAAPDQLIAAADRAMYAAKARGRNRVATRVRRATPSSGRR
jgi:diguanylate cyclase (GGDEF)-like protein